MGEFDSLFSEFRPRAMSGRREVNPPAVYDAGSEWRARLLGRLGRPLLREIEAYLEFFAIARTIDTRPFSSVALER